jgi:hypothetical protein
MSWRIARAAASEGVPHDARLGLTWRQRSNSAASGRCSFWPTAAHCMQRKAEYTRRRNRAAGRQSCYVDVVLQSFLLDVPLANYSFWTAIRLHSEDQLLIGAVTCVKCKSTSPCLLAIPAFDRIARLSNRHLNSKRAIISSQRFWSKSKSRDC